MGKIGILPGEMKKNKSEPTRRSTRMGQAVKRSTKSSSRDLPLVLKRRLAALEAAQGLGVTENNVFATLL